MITETQADNRITARTLKKQNSTSVICSRELLDSCFCIIFCSYQCRKDTTSCSKFYAFYGHLVSLASCPHILVPRYLSLPCRIHDWTQKPKSIDRRSKICKISSHWLLWGFFNFVSIRGKKGEKCKKGKSLENC